MKRVACLIGPPGVGKGTFAAQFLNTYPDLDLRYISVGHALRKVLSDGSGNLAKLELVESLLSDFLKTGKKFILDGYPRSLEQLEIFHKRATKAIFIHMQLSDIDQLYKRLMNRYTCNFCGKTEATPNRCDTCDLEMGIRLDDANLDAINRRMSIYSEEITRIQNFCQTRELALVHFDVSSKDWFERLNNLLLLFFRD